MNQSDNNRFGKSSDVLTERIAEAQQAKQSSQWELALQLWGTCIREHDQGNSCHWHAEYANALTELGQLDEASQKFNELIRDFPDFEGGHVGLARLATIHGDWELALSLWNGCIQNFDTGNHPWWQANLAHALTELQRFSEADEIYSKLTYDFPEFEGGHIGLARLATLRCDWELAFSLWEDCIQRFDNLNHPWWHSNSAHALSELHRFIEAEEAYKKLTLNFPDFFSGHAGLASIAQRRQDWQLAAKLWEYCIQHFDENNHWWLKAYAQALVELARFSEAKTIGEQIAETHQEDQHTLDLLARISWHSHDMPQCLRYADQLIKHSPHSPRGYYWSEQALIKLGRFAEAADVHLAWPGDGSNSPQQIVLPDNYPAEMVLPPIRGAGNDYGFIEKQHTAFQNNGVQYTLAVSIVIPVYNRADMLAKTLAAFVHQTYPQELIEVIIADDGSSDHIATVLNTYKDHLNLRYVRQEDKGYRVAAVRNLGIQAASHQYIILQDGDVIPARGLVEKYMSYFHVTQQAVLFGIRSYVCADEYRDEDLFHHPELIEQLPEVRPANPIADWQTIDGRSFDWRIPILIKTDNLKESIFPCHLFAGGSAAFPKAAIRSAGSFDEEFKHWGGEDTEFGYRLYNQGYYFIPIPEVICFHQEPAIEKGDYQVDRQAGLEISKPVLQQKCPIPSIRNSQPNVVYQVPKVSIYIPAYNVGEFIKEAVDSVLAQTFTDLEVVICDDGSTDNTLQILQKHFTNHHRVRWVSQAHQGIAAASNRAVSLCRGMYIGQLDGDDLLEPQAVELLADFLDSNSAGAVYSRYTWIDRNGQVMREISSVEFSREHLLTVMICTAFRMFRKRDWLRTDGFDESLTNAVDYDMMLKLSEVCTIKYVPQLTYRYRYHGQNTSLVNQDKQEHNHLVAVNKSLQRMGLSDQWQAVAGSPSNRRKVKFLHHL